jgi:hypothetical protein
MVLAADPAAAATSAEEIGESAQQQLVEREEAIRDSKWTIARSRHLIERLEALKAGLRGGGRAR